jgi:hypothetical protein
VGRLWKTTRNLRIAGLLADVLSWYLLNTRKNEEHYSLAAAFAHPLEESLECEEIVMLYLVYWSIMKELLFSFTRTFSSVGTELVN